MVFFFEPHIKLADSPLSTMNGMEEEMVSLLPGALPEEIAALPKKKTFSEMFEAAYVPPGMLMGVTVGHTVSQTISKLGLDLKDNNFANFATILGNGVAPMLITTSLGMLVVYGYGMKHYKEDDCDKILRLSAITGACVTSGIFLYDDLYDDKDEKDEKGDMRFYQSSNFIVLFGLLCILYIEAKKQVLASADDLKASAKEFVKLAANEL